MRRQAEKEAAVRRAQETYSREAGWPSSVAVDMVPQPRDVHRLIESRKYRGVVKQRSGA